MTIEELFGTLQMSVVATWRKHLRSAKYGKHMALDEFYKEMPEKVDDLIEAWMGAHGKKIGAFQNTLSSSNMNTLKYLNELKRVCKEGYSLLGDKDELKSLMDDIVNLINSTLYKVKELSESNIVNLKDFINESLVNEVKTEELLFMVDHGDPEIIFCINGDINKLEKMIEDDYDWYYGTWPINTKLATVQWNDESIYVIPVEGNNLVGAKKKDLDNIQAQLDKQKDQIEKDGYVYIESNIFGGANEWEDAKPNDKAQKYLDMFIEMMDDSYVDGDSGYAYSLIDISKGKSLLGNDGVVFMSANEFIEEYMSDEE